MPKQTTKETPEEAGQRVREAFIANWSQGAISQFAVLGFNMNNILQAAFTLISQSLSTVELHPPGTRARLDELEAAEKVRTEKKEGGKAVKPSATEA